MSALGHFDPSFYGVTLHLRTDAQHHVALNYAEADDVGTWAAGVDDASLGALGALSAADHEIRHFHDSLLSPWGCNMMGMRLSIVVNAMQALSAIAVAPGRFVPTPMARWLEWSPDERARWLADTGAVFGIADADDVVNLPWLTAETVCNFDAAVDPMPYQVWLAVDGERKLREARRRRPSPIAVGTISPDDAFECAAHAVQGQAIWQGQGEAAARAYLHHLDTAPLDYLVAYRFVQHGIRQVRDVPIERLTALFTWTLLATPEPGTGSDPALRLSGLMALAATQPTRLLADIGVEALWDDLDDELGHDSWREHLARADDMARRRGQAYAKLRVSPSGNRLAPVLDIADAWLEDRAQLVAAFRSDPESYVNPARYLNDTGETWPLPAFQLRFGDRAHVRDTPLRLPTMRALTIDEAELEAVAYIRTPRPERLEATFDHAMIAAMVNHVFFDTPVGDVTERTVRAMIARDCGKQLVSVF